MKITLIYFGAVAFAILGSKVACWNVRRSLPVPEGSFKFFRFYFWWTLSVVGSAFVIVPAFVLMDYFIPSEPHEIFQRVREHALIILGAPFWFSVGYGVKLQYFSPIQGSTGSEVG